jgi:hypothetical protein
MSSHATRPALQELQAQLEDQDRRLALAHEQIAARGSDDLLIRAAVLDAIDRACAVPVPSTALRG